VSLTYTPANHALWAATTQLRSDGSTLREAIARTRCGPPDIVQFAEIKKPIPQDNEVLIKLCAAAVNPLDLFSMRGAPLIRPIPGLRTPKHKVLGCDIAVQVEVVGSRVRAGNRTSPRSQSGRHRQNL
jgi:NADPH:quinone reductase-like Zn-dependent oxidoreductase